MSPDELDRLSREDLIARARVLGVERAELMTRIELKDEIIRRSEPDAARRQRSRGWLGVARDLVASVVEAKLNMRDTAALIRGEGLRGLEVTEGPPPVATVTLAEIYAAQGHFDRALNMIEEVLQREPEHEAARALRDRLRADRERGVGAARKKRPSAEPPTEAAPSSEPAPVAERAQPPESAEPAPPAEAAPSAESPPIAEPARVAEVAPTGEAPVEPEAPAEPAPGAEAAPSAETGVIDGSAIEAEEPPPPTEPSRSHSPRPAPEPIAEPARTAEPAPEPVISAVPAITAAPVPNEPGLVVVREGLRAYVYWEIPPSWLRLENGGGTRSLVARTLTVSPGSSAPERKETDIQPAEQVGGIWVTAPREDAVLRAALGYLDRERFRAVCVASELSRSGAASERSFCPLGADPGRLSALEARALAHLEHARG